MDGTWEPSWDWVGPYWEDLNDPDRATVGWLSGDGLSAENQEQLQAFIDSLAEFATNPMTPQDEFGLTSIALWEGPLNLQDGTEMVGPGQMAEPLDVWYLPQLLEGMVGASTSE
jgi:simple sugar transport system substrate-binding protein